MAKAKRPNRQGEIEALVKIRHDGRAFAATLPVNPGFRAPNEVDRERGVDPEEPERDQGERAIAARTLRELWPSNLRLWIFGAQRAYGGNARLVDELMAMKPVPSGRTRAKHRADLLRAIQRAGPAKNPTRKQAHSTMAPDTATHDYRERIMLLILRTRQVVLGIFGRWVRVREGEVLEPFYATYWTDPSDPIELQAAREVIAAGGAGMVAMMEESYARASGGYGLLDLDWLHALYVQID